MCILRSLFCILVAATTVPVSFAQSVQESIHSWESSAEAVWSYDVFLDVVVRSQHEGQLKVIGEHRIRQRYLGDNWRVDLLKVHKMYHTGGEEQTNAAPDEIVAFAYADEQVRYYSSKGSFGELKTKGVDQISRAKILAPHLFESFKAIYFGESYASMLGYRAEVGKATHGDHGDIQLWLPRSGVVVPHFFWNYDFEVHLSPKNAFLPTLVRFGTKLHQNPDFICEFHNELAQYDGKVWAPSRVTRRTFGSIRGVDNAAGLPLEEITLTIDDSMSHFNIDIPHEVFELTFPPGTVVYDNASDENYVVTEGGKRDYAAFSVLARAKAQELSTNKSDPTERRSLVGILIANIIGVLLVCWFMYRRPAR